MPNVSNLKTNNPMTNVEYTCTTLWADGPVTARIECGNGEMFAGQIMNGMPFKANCNYSTPSMGQTAICTVQGNTTPSCQLPVNINRDG